jgi:hypothetical protein
MTSEFYQENPDLKEHKQLVAQVAERIEGERPGAGFKDVLIQAAKESRDVISQSKTMDARHPKDVDWYNKKTKDLKFEDL